MAQMTKLYAEYGVSAEIQGVWHRMTSGVEVSLQEGDDPEDVKRKAWNTVKTEVEKQVLEASS